MKEGKLLRSIINLKKRIQLTGNFRGVYFNEKSISPCKSSPPPPRFQVCLMSNSSFIPPLTLMHHLGNFSSTIRIQDLSCINMDPDPGFVLLNMDPDTGFVLYKYGPGSRIRPVKIWTQITNIS